jgi:hypothetical protein
MTPELKQLLEDIQDWMMENDYECGPRGGDIYQEISEILKKHDNHTKDRHT